MRKLLATAVAIAPLAIASGVSAETVISTGRTTPITTANATGSAADDIRFSNAGSITLTSGAAVTLNSSHDVDLDTGARITMESAADGATGILALGGNTGSIIMGGVIRITDTLGAATDTDSDGDLDGPFASGTGRYGIRVMGDQPLTGNLTTERTGSILVEGNQSYGIAVEGDLDGDFDSFAGITVTGADSYGVRVTGDVSGDVFQGGNSTVQGAGSVAASYEGDIDGTLTIQGALTATGFRYTTRPSSEVREKLDADDLLIGGPALRIAGDVAGGVALDIPPQVAPDDDDDDDDDDEDEDTDGNGVPDAEESSAAITSFGSAPAVEIGSTTRTVTLGAVGTGDEAYGFINRGGITASGVYDNIEATGLRIGIEGGQAVTVVGGVRNEGGISAVAYEADGTAVEIGAGASVPTFYNSGSLQTSVISEGEDVATGLLIAEGATVTTIDNAGGGIVGRLAGEKGDAYGIRDLSGAVTTINNQGGIAAAVARNVTGEETGDEPITGRGVAIDVSANTTGVTLVQTGIPYVDDGDEDTDPPTDTDEDGVPDTAEPSIVGEILLGSGADTLDIRNGTVFSDISFGDGVDTLAISGGAAVRGALSDADGQLAIDVADGVLDARQSGVLDVTSLNVGADGNLIVTIDPEGDGIGGFNVNGTATLADGAGLGLRFSSLLQEDGRFTVIRADDLNYGAIDESSLEENSPYLYVVDAGADVAAGEVFIDARRRTSDEIGLIASEDAAFDAVYGALGTDDELRDAFLAQTGREGFINLYEQMLPDHSGGPLLSLATGVDAVTRALAGRNDTAQPGETSAWLQEINFYADKDKDQAYGFRSEGFGVAGGIERGTNMGAFGLSVAFTSSDLEDPESEAEEVLSANLVELGLYYRAQGQGWTTWARAAAGYAYFDATRTLVGAGLFRTNESEWNGFSLAAAAGANYEKRWGRYSVRPEVIAEYFSLNEDGRTETGGGDGFDLTIDDREGHLLSAIAAVNFGVGFGENYWIRPEIRVGYKQNISFDAGETIARFTSGGAPFVLASDTIEGGGPILGFKLNLGNELGMLSLEGDAEMIDDYIRYALLLRASFRF